MRTYTVTEDCGIKTAPCLYRLRGGLCESGQVHAVRLPSGNLDVYRGPYPIEYRRSGAACTAGWGPMRSSNSAALYVKADADDGTAILLHPEIDAMI